MINSDHRVKNTSLYKTRYACSYTGIYRDKTMADYLMYIPNHDTQKTSSLDYNKRLKRLDTQQQNSKIFPKVDESANKKMLL